MDCMPWGVGTYILLMQFVSQLLLSRSCASWMDIEMYILRVYADLCFSTQWIMEKLQKVLQSMTLSLHHCCGQGRSSYFRCSAVVSSIALSSSSWWQLSPALPLALHLWVLGSGPWALDNLAFEIWILNSCPFGLFAFELCASERCAFELCALDLRLWQIELWTFDLLLFLFLNFRQLCSVQLNFGFLTFELWAFEPCAFWCLGSWPLSSLGSWLWTLSSGQFGFCPLNS